MSGVAALDIPGDRLLLELLIQGREVPDPHGLIRAARDQEPHDRLTAFCSPSRATSLASMASTDNLRNEGLGGNSVAASVRSRLVWGSNIPVKRGDPANRPDRRQPARTTVLDPRRPFPTSSGTGM